MRLISKLYSVSELSGDALVIQANPSDEARRYRVGAGPAGDRAARDIHGPSTFFKDHIRMCVCVCRRDCGG